MTTNTTIFKLAGTIAGNGVGKFLNGMPEIFNEDGTSPLYAAYMTGFDFMLGTEFAGLPLKDVSTNARGDLIQTGANGAGGMQTLGFKGSSGIKLTTPFTADDLAAAGTANQFSVTVFGQFGTTYAHQPIVAPVTGSAANEGATVVKRGFQMLSNSGYDINVVGKDDTQSRQATGPSPTLTSGRGTANLLLGGDISLTGQTLWAMNASDSAPRSQTTAWLDLDPARVNSGDGTSVARIGGGAFDLFISNNAAFDNQGRGALFWERNLTAAERATEAAWMRKLYAAHGLTF